MLDIKKILARSWHILWTYRTLWIFGFMLALAAGSSRISNNNNYRVNDNSNQQSGIHAPDDWEGLKGDTLAEKMDDAFRQMGAGIAELQGKYPVEFQMGIAVAITFFVVIVIVSVIVAILRYVAEAASIRMVDEYEQSGTKVGFRQGWKYGWSRAAWRLFLSNFLAHIPVFVTLIVVVLCVWQIASAFIGGVETTIVNSVIAGIGLSFLFIFVTVILMVALLVLRDFAWRKIVLENAGVMDSLRNSAALMKRQWKNVGVMWLVMIGIKIAWALAFMILILPLLVVSILTAVGGALVAIIPALATAGIASMFSAPDYWPWVFAAIVGAPFFFVIAFSPVLLVSGWNQIYQSSVWTLTYREVKALDAVSPAATDQASAAG